MTRTAASRPGEVAPAAALVAERLAASEAARDVTEVRRATVRALFRRLASERGLGDAVPDLGDGTPDDRAARDAMGRLIDALEGRDDAIGRAYESLLTYEARTDGASGRLTLSPVDRGERRASGSFYTPPAVVEGVLDTALGPLLDERLAGLADPGEVERAILGLRVCDPAVGSGRFLVIAARRLGERLALARARGGEPGDDDLVRARADVMRACLFGVDVDPVAAEVCRLSLWLELGDNAAPLSVFDGRVLAGDALLGAPRGAGARDRDAADAWAAGAMGGATPPGGFFHWTLAFPEVFARGGFDLVVGNPPFLNQLGRDTAAARAEAALFRRRWDGAASGYADGAAMFLLLGAEIARRDDGRVALVQPQSLLASADAGPVRDAALRAGALEALWVSGERAFPGASVFTCAPSLRLGEPRGGAIAVYRGVAFERLADEAGDGLGARETWGHLAARAAGVPRVEVEGGRTIGDFAEATADFRDEYYGLDGCIVEDDAAPRGSGDGAFPPIVTSGLIDLAECRWGRAPARILKRRWAAPRVDRGRLERAGRLGPWAARRLVPKVLLATQTRVIEVFVDEAGRFLPCTPLVTVTPRPGADPWRIASALASPVSTAIAAGRYAGTALSADAIKLSAKQAMALPAPTDAGAWAEAADLFRAAQSEPDAGRRIEALRRFGRASLASFGVGGDGAGAVESWWAGRLERGRGRRAGA